MTDIAYGPAATQTNVGIGGPLTGRIPLAALVRLHLTYLWRHHRLLSLETPTRFTELVQWRKLYDHDARMPLLADKVRVKAFVEDRLGTEWVTPTLWHGAVLPEQPIWAAPYVVKSRHGCNQRIFVRDDLQDWRSVRKQAAGWLDRPYGFWLDEWLYSRIEPGILVEPFIGPTGTLPIDYKIYVFHGRACFIQVHLEREHHHRWILLNRDWHRVSSETDDPDPERPSSFFEMMIGAEELGKGFDFVRVDFYDVQGAARFGEMTFYPGSGLDPFDPPSLDEMLGERWRDPNSS